MKKLLLILACILVAVLVMPAFIEPPAHEETHHEGVAAMGKKLLEAFEAYHAEYDAYPDGSPAEIGRALRGDNEKQIVFLQGPEQSHNEDGELLDPWGTPFKITFDAETQKPLIHSAGKNRLFEEHGDDYRSWQPYNTRPHKRGIE
jgi:hypothetical protein